MNTNTRQKIMAATGRAGAAAGWTEDRLQSHVKRRGGTTSDIQAAMGAFRAAKANRLLEHRTPA